MQYFELLTHYLKLITHYLNFPTVYLFFVLAKTRLLLIYSILSLPTCKYLQLNIVTFYFKIKLLKFYI